MPGQSPRLQTNWIWLAVLIVIIAGVADFVFWYQKKGPGLISYNNTPVDITQKIDGPCAYADYSGTCQVISVDEVSDQPIGGNSGANLNFTFSLNKEKTITQTGVELKPGEIYQKRLARNGADEKVGSQACLDKFQIQKGKTYDCRLSVITSGTCTPRIFKFNLIDDKCLMY